MNYHEMLLDKAKFIAMLVANPMLRYSRNANPDKSNFKPIQLASIQVRSEGADGATIPDDECQVDIVISNSDVDSYGSIMTEKTLRNYAEDAAKGVGFMREHDEGIDTQIGKTIAATYDEANKRVVATVSMLRDTDDTPENLRINEYIRRIERKYYDSASVAFRDATETCNLCGKEIFDFYRDDPCPHVPKKVYNGTVCTYDVDDARLRHVGLVSAPSNQAAKVLDLRNWSEDARKVKQEGDVGAAGTNNEKSLLEKDGLKYRESLIKTALEEGVRAQENFDEDKWKKRFDTMEAEQIIDQTETWTEMGDMKWGSGGRKTESGTPNNTGNPNQSVIVMPNYLFESEF